MSIEGAGVGAGAGAGASELTSQSNQLSVLFGVGTAAVAMVRRRDMLRAHTHTYRPAASGYRAAIYSVGTRRE